MPYGHRQSYPSLYYRLEIRQLCSRSSILISLVYAVSLAIFVHFLSELDTLLALLLAIFWLVVPAKSVHNGTELAR